MGWLRTIVLGDFGNRLDIGDNEKRIARLRKSLRDYRQKTVGNKSRIDALEEENEQLELVVTMLMRRLQEKNILSEEEIRSLAEIIDPPENKT